MVKLLLIALIAGALANGLAAQSKPPLLIDTQPAPPSLDANR